VAVHPEAAAVETRCVDEELRRAGRNRGRGRERCLVPRCTRALFSKESYSIKLVEYSVT